MTILSLLYLSTSLFAAAQADDEQISSALLCAHVGKNHEFLAALNALPSGTLPREVNNRSLRPFLEFLAFLEGKRKDETEDPFVPISIKKSDLAISLAYLSQDLESFIEWLNEKLAIKKSTADLEYKAAHGTIQMIDLIAAFFNRFKPFLSYMNKLAGGEEDFKTQPDVLLQLRLQWGQKRLSALQTLSIPPLTLPTSQTSTEVLECATPPALSRIPSDLCEQIEKMAGGDILLAFKLLLQASSESIDPRQRFKCLTKAILLKGENGDETLLDEANKLLISLTSPFNT